MPAITTTDNKRVEISLGVEEIKFIDALKTMADLRDNRGKRHSQAFLIATFVFATLVGRSKVSGIHRYISIKFIGYARLLDIRMPHRFLALIYPECWPIWIGWL